jgi:hypothetical protein
MHPNKLTLEVAAKWPEFVRLHSDGYPMPNFLRVQDMPDEAYKDLIGGYRIRPRQGGDGNSLFSCPKQMKTLVKIDTNDNEVVAYIFVDARIELVNEPWFDLSEVISLPPSHWSVTMKSRYPGAVPSVVYPARW